MLVRPPRLIVVPAVLPPFELLLLVVPAGDPPSVAELAPPKEVDGDEIGLPPVVEGALPPRLEPASSDELLQAKVETSAKMQAVRIPRVSRCLKKESIKNQEPVKMTLVFGIPVQPLRSRNTFGRLEILDWAFGRRENEPGLSGLGALWVRRIDCQMTDALYSRAMFECEREWTNRTRCIPFNYNDGGIDSLATVTWMSQSKAGGTSAKQRLVWKKSQRLHHNRCVRDRRYNRSLAAQA
jgi:hypothetical protein